MPSSPPVLPKALPSGGCIGVVSPSYPTPELAQFEAGEAWLTGLGYRVKRFAHAGNQWRYLAGTDEERAADVMAALLDDTVDAVWCARGGYGCQRVLPYLDWAALKTARPKPVIGFSDITVLHAAIAQQLGWATFYGPMVTSNLAEMPITATNSGNSDVPYTLAQCLGLITGKAARPYDLVNQDTYYPIHTPQGNTPIIAPVTGGNLTLLAALCGTPFQSKTAGHIVFIEDWKEPFYSIDRQFQQLKQAGMLDEIAGLLFGDFSHSEAQAGLTLPELFAELTVECGVPVGYGWSIGHGDVTATLPFGVPLTWQPHSGQLTLPQPVVA